MLGQKGKATLSQLNNDENADFGTKSTAVIFPFGLVWLKFRFGFEYSIHRWRGKLV